MSGPPTGRRSTTSLRVAGVLCVPRKKKTKTFREKKTTTTFQRRIGENRRSLTPIQTDSERRKTKKKKNSVTKNRLKGRWTEWRQLHEVDAVGNEPVI